jgi:uncharacterized linocin/CFP29 family protein
MTSYVLSPQQYRQIKKTVLQHVLPNLVGRQVLPLDPEVGPGAQEVTRNMLDIPTTPAKVIAKGGRYGVITPTENEVTVYIRKIGQAFVVTDEDLESSQVTGRPLDKRTIQVASRKIQEFEDEFIFNGYAPADELGLIGSTAAQSGMQVACANKWTTPACEPYDDVNNAVGKIEANYYEAQFMVINYSDAKLLRREDTYGNIYLKKILDNLSIPEDNILSSAAIAPGTALIGDMGPDIAELKQVEPITVLPPIRTTEDSQQINIRERLGIDIYEPQAYCLLTNIS